MRLAVLIDGSIARWQLRALERACANDELYLLRCPPHGSPRKLRHGLYYFVNLLSVRNRATRRVPFPEAAFAVIDHLDFRPEIDGAWARLPDTVLHWLRTNRVEAVIKFGLGLLRVPSPEQLPAPILSFHHGDPRHYRGRPAGFYEMLRGEAFVGQVVQALGAKLDGGRVYAFAQSNVVAHSYKATLLAAFHLSSFLLCTALDNVRRGTTLAIKPDGRNYRLPGNLLVVRFLLKMAWSAVRRLAYGALVEKRWRVATARTAADSSPADAITEASSAPWSVLPVPAPYTFYADPFFGADAGEIFVEALNGRNGKGEIVRIGGSATQVIGGFCGHVSYPGGIELDGQWLLVPETASWATPAAYRIAGSTAGPAIPLDIAADGLLDPTLVRHDGRIYLFANLREDGAGVLHLWHAQSLQSRFERHSCSPVRVSARGSRMAGEIAAWGGQLFRIGQDSKRGYGDGALAFRIVRLDSDHYVEEPAGEAAFTTVRGPHTVSRRGTCLLFDYYEERFSLLAGVRRILARLGG